ncbi:hypothetical protein PJI16_03730 [Nitrospira sp. MA-1]|nr:hypothetical protein [Nitrospira sp. MA-1]
MAEHAQRFDVHSNQILQWKTLRLDRAPDVCASGLHARAARGCEGPSRLDGRVDIEK